MIRELIPWITSGGTLVTMWAAGAHKRWAWAWGIANQIPWLALMWLTGTWGLLPLTCALVVIYGRNWLRWKPPYEPVDDAAPSGDLSMTLAPYHYAVDGDGVVIRLHHR